MLSPDICQKNGDVEESRLPPFHVSYWSMISYFFPEIAFRGPRQGFVEPRKIIVLQARLRASKGGSGGISLAGLFSTNLSCGQKRAEGFFLYILPMYLFTRVSFPWTFHQGLQRDRGAWMCRIGKAGMVQWQMVPLGQTSFQIKRGCLKQWPSQRSKSVFKTNLPEAQS